jgi:hypothetical protein
MNTTENHTDDYDRPWKEGMEQYFKELMQFFFPDIAREIAWDKGQLNEDIEDFRKTLEEITAEDPA